MSVEFGLVGQPPENNYEDILSNHLSLDDAGYLKASPTISVERTMWVSFSANEICHSLDLEYWSTW
jgi:hypothetical protein